MSEIEIQLLSLSDPRCDSRLAVIGIAKLDSSGRDAHVARQDLSQVSPRDYEMPAILFEMKTICSGLLIRGEKPAQTCDNSGRLL